MTTANAFDLESILNSASKPASATKSKIPIIPTPANMRDKVSRIAELAGKIDSMKAESSVVETEVLAWADGERSNLMAQEGYVGSVKVEGNKEVITLSWQHKYSKIGVENLEVLKELFGSKLSQFFGIKNIIEVKEDATDEELTELISLVGRERFAKFFTVKRELKPTPRYTQEKYLFSAEERKILDGIARQYKPSVKTK